MGESTGGSGQARAHGRHAATTPRLGRERETPEVATARQWTCAGSRRDVGAVAGEANEGLDPSS